MKRHQRKCRCCKKWFTTDPRNHHHQQFCLRIKCRKASKAASQKRWQSKPANRRHWCGPDEVERVRAWRKLHPFYWKRAGRRKYVALQDFIAAAHDHLPLWNNACQLLAGRHHKTVNQNRQHTT